MNNERGILKVKEIVKTMYESIDGEIFETEMECRCYEEIHFGNHPTVVIFKDLSEHTDVFLSNGNYGVLQEGWYIPMQFTDTDDIFEAALQSLRNVNSIVQRHGSCYNIYKVKYAKNKGAAKSYLKNIDYNFAFHYHNGELTSEVIC